MEQIETIRARYSAFAYAIPSFIMASTHPKSKEYTDNKVSLELFGRPCIQILVAVASRSLQAIDDFE